MSSNLCAQALTTEVKIESETTNKIKPALSRSSSSSSEKIGNDEYYKGNKIITGSRGGRYYINSHGNKTYIPHPTTKNDAGEYYNGHEVLT
jgi:colicin import membrane protein